MDHLLVHVQWLDARQNALLVMSHTETSPVRVASKRLYDMLADISGHLGVLTHCLIGDNCSFEEFAVIVFKQVIRLAAELWFRFLHFRSGLCHWFMQSTLRSRQASRIEFGWISGALPDVAGLLMD